MEAWFLLPKDNFIFSILFLMLPGYHLKDPNVSQYLNYVTSYAYFQELERISHLKKKRAESKDQGVECKNQDGHGHCVQKNYVQKGQVQQKKTND